MPGSRAPPTRSGATPCSAVSRSCPTGWSGCRARASPCAATPCWSRSTWAGGRRLGVAVTHLHHTEGPEGTRVRLAQLPVLLDAVAGRPADELTWPSHRPNRRIDYIWLSGDLAAGGFAALASTASDHRGLAVTVRPG